MLGLVAMWMSPLFQSSMNDHCVSVLYSSESVRYFSLKSPEIPILFRRSTMYASMSSRACLQSPMNSSRGVFLIWILYLRSVAISTGSPFLSMPTG